MLRYKGSTEYEEEEEMEEDSNDDSDEESEEEEPSEEKPDVEMKDDDQNVKRIALKLFKYW